MRKRLEKWGYAGGMLLCILTILFAAIYTRQDDLKRHDTQSASQSQDETLSDALAARWQRPVDAQPSARFAGAVRDEKTHIWRLSADTVYPLAPGQSIYAVSEGDVLFCGDGCIVLSHADGYESRCTGALSMRVKAGEHVNAGQVIAVSAGTGELRVELEKNGTYLDIESLVSP